ncbi:hypothetical protein [Pelagicoccus sp. SDUM812002]|uniref:hypothetical protein n=1 Tax=Pelagicoccus sp. SDUM812002 TaxID=3041266 RepID=UPI00280E96B7|nr:hypothetical protein [Pelagicoccus sp. SDUM812002]MDQ8184090.1 hypothetical protein [Pelagicoccus sp. SDUM812002]
MKNKEKDTIITAIEASQKLMPGLHENVILPESVLEVGQSALKKNYPTLLSKSRKKLETASKRRDSLQVTEPCDSKPFLTISALKQHAEDLGYHPSPQFLEHARLHILAWLGTNAAAYDIFRSWSKSANRTTPPQREPESEKPNPNRKKEGLDHGSIQ